MNDNDLIGWVLAFAVIFLLGLAGLFVSAFLQ